MGISAKEAIRKFKVDLLQKLPLEDPVFFAKVDIAGLFPSDTGRSIKAEKTRSHKVDYFIDNVIEPGADEYLPKLLEVMKDSTFANVEILASQILAAMKAGTYYIYMSIYILYVCT